MLSIVNLRGGGSAFVLDLSGPTPVIVHWGADLGDSIPAALSASPVAHSALDQPPAQTLVPQSSSGWRGRSALEGHRVGGRAFSAALVTTNSHALAPDGHEITMTDRAAGLTLTIQIHLGQEGMLRIRSILQNVGDDDFALQSLSTTLPTGLGAAEILDLTGRWCREQHPQRQSLRQGTWLREYRHGRTGHDSSLFTAVGTTGFGNRSGSVWATHFGFSGNRITAVEKTPTGPALIGNAELLGAGEITLAAGDSYQTPWTYASFSARGLDGVTDTFHCWLRSRSTHPATVRPVVLNTWEAVYFHHNLESVVELADQAELLGVERFVLDDGWFRHRRNDKAGLGDWYVDDDVWPGGLTGLIDAVRVRGMQFGLWVEPEMVNEDSDVIRAHPDWISGAGLGRTPVDWRHQQVLDLVNPDAFAYIFDRLDALLTDNAISYLKWDQNRDLTEMGNDGSPSTHEQTLAAYRLIDQLRLAHPEVEIESCSSGGARVDLGILERTDRVWAAVALYKKHRGLIHSGVAVHGDLVDPAYLLGGSVAQDGSEALFSFVSVASSFDEIPGRVGFPGLDPDTSYDVKVIFPTATSPYGDRANVEWIPGGITATGRFLAEVGLPMPILNPEQGVLIHLEESAGA